LFVDSHKKVRFLGFSSEFVVMFVLLRLLFRLG
jgi:hypothetical protein